MGHSKLNPASTFSGAWEGEDPPHSLSRDDAAAGGVSKRRRLETVVAPKARQAWPCLAGLSRGRRESEAPARSAPQARDPLAKQWRGFQPPLDRDPWNALIVLGAKNRASRELQLGPYPPLGKCRAVSGVRWEWIQPILEPHPLSRAARWLSRQLTSTVSKWAGSETPPRQNFKA